MSADNGINNNNNTDNKDSSANNNADKDINTVDGNKELAVKKKKKAFAAMFAEAIAVQSHQPMGLYSSENLVKDRDKDTGAALDGAASSIKARGKPKNGSDSEDDEEDDNQDENYDDKKEANSGSGDKTSNKGGSVTFISSPSGICSSAVRDENKDEEKDKEKIEKVSIDDGINLNVDTERKGEVSGFEKGQQQIQKPPILRVDCREEEIQINNIRLFSLSELPLERFVNCTHLEIRKNIIHELAYSPNISTIDEIKGEITEVDDNNNDSISKGGKEGNDNKTLVNKTVDEGGVDLNDKDDNKKDENKNNLLVPVKSINLPDFLAEKLVVLDLFDNKIRKITKGFFDNFKSLRKLDLSYNQIKTIENLEPLAVTLEELYLVENRIKSLFVPPQRKKKIKEGEGKDLEDNLIDQKVQNKNDFSERTDDNHDLQIEEAVINSDGTYSCLSQLTNLRLLELGGNRIRSILYEPPPSTKNGENLDQNDDKKNNIEEGNDDKTGEELNKKDKKKAPAMVICPLDSLRYLEELWLGKNKISSIGRIFNHLHNLRRLSLQANRITNVPADAFPDKSCNPNLQELYLSENGLTEIENVSKLPSLQLLDYSMNSIERINEEVVNEVNMPDLREFWITDNRINSWDEVKKLAVFGKINDSERTGGFDDKGKSVSGNISDSTACGVTDNEKEGNNKEYPECKLTVLYLERNPIEADRRYRDKVYNILPFLKQIDSWPVVNKGNLEADRAIHRKPL